MQQVIKGKNFESLEDGGHAEFEIGDDLNLFVTHSDERDTTAVVLADEDVPRQASIIVEDGMWMTR